MNKLSNSKTTKMKKNEGEKKKNNKDGWQRSKKIYLYKYIYMKKSRNINGLSINLYKLTDR